MLSSGKRELFASPQVVGTVHSPKALEEACALPPGAVDWLELRVDHFLEDLETLEQAARELKFPLIVTVRHREEGGAGQLRQEKRRELFERFLPWAELVDLERRSLAALGPTVRSGQAQLIISDHHFHRTPGVAVLLRRVRELRSLRPVIIKFATLTTRAEHLADLLTLLAECPQQPLALMGMGPLGKVSRLVLAQAGSVLNYGYLGEPQVPGQWPARLLKERLAELG